MLLMEVVKMSHLVFGLIALATFVGHLVTNIYINSIYWLPQALWTTSVVFSLLAIYRGITIASALEVDEQGSPIASAIVGSTVLLGLLISAVGWVMSIENGYQWRLTR
jgi:hypothetical protein